MDGGKLIAVLVAGAFAAVLGIGMYKALGGDKAAEAAMSEKAAKQLAAQGVNVGAVAPVAAKPAGWVYTMERDKMTDKQQRWAEVRSGNSLRLEFPYNGTNHGRIYVRQRDGKPVEVFVNIDKGQILCSSYDGCNAVVRFDDDAPQTFQSVGPADHSSETIFIRNTALFMARASKAKRILVQLNLYKGGSPVLEFDTPASLAWGDSKG